VPRHGSALLGGFTQPAWTPGHAPPSVTAPDYEKWRMSPPTIAPRQQIRRSHSPVTFPAMHRHHWLPMLLLYFCSPSHAAPVSRNETASPNPAYVVSAYQPQPWSRESIIALSTLLVAFLCCLVSVAWPSIKRCVNTRTAAQCKHIPSSHNSPSVC
jgi:hypothetical protein